MKMEKQTYEELLRRIQELERSEYALNKVKKELLDNEIKYRALITNIPGMVYRGNPDWSTEIISNCELVCGYSASDFENKTVNWMEIIHPDDKKRVLEEVDRISGKSKHIEQEYRIIAKDGSTRWLRDQKSMVFRKDGSFVGVDGIVFDITDRHMADQKKKESDKRYRLLLQNTNDAVFVHAISHDGPGMFLEVNDQACQMLGYTREEFLEMDISAIDVPEQKSRIPRIMEQLYKTGQSIFSTEEMTKDRRRIPVEVSARLFDYQGIPAVLAVVRNITERKKAEAEHDRLISAINQVGDLVVITSIEGVIKYVNPAFVKITGYNKEDALGETPRLLKSGHHEIGFYKNLWDTILSGKQWTGRVVNKRKDGSLYTGECSISPVKNQDFDIVNFVWISRDITKEIEIEKRSQQNQKLEAIGALAGGIAHDFNNILSSVIGFTELALDEVDKNTTIEDSLQEVYSAGKRAKDLVGQILAFARQSDEELRSIQVSSIVKEVLKFIRSSIPTTIEIHQNIESDSLIMGNATRVHQVMMNLCTNAAHAMEKDGGTLDITLKDIAVDKSVSNKIDLKPGNYLKLTVSDTGTGISPDIIDSIFEPYFTTKELGEGTGMGLALVHGITEAYGGKIIVDSELGKGTVFSVYLPITNKHEEHRPYGTEKLPSGNERVLFVDDELPIAKMGSQLLERLGYSVTARTSSVEALELFRSKPTDFDLVITDMTMPNMTGDKLALELMKIRPDIPIILCTGYSKKMSDETALEFGIKAFVYKPMVKSDLAKTIRKVLDEAKEKS